MQVIEVIQTIRDSAFEELTLRQILAVLEDGEALTNLGFTDDDQEAIEEAHDSIIEYLNKNTDKQEI